MMISFISLYFHYHQPLFTIIHFIIMNLITIFLFTIFSLKITFSQKSFILTSSVGYYNYRQIANALEVYHWLQNLGFQDHNQLLLFPENVGCCQKNAIQGQISFRDNQYDNLNRNLQVDYKYYSINARSVANTLGMKYPPHSLNFKRLKLNDQPYFIYITGHGGDFYFKIRERQALISQNFKHVIEDLSMRSNASVFLITDSCSAITPFEDIDWQNFVALGSSSIGQKSLSMGYDKLINGPKSDEFTYYLSEYLKQFNPSKSNSTIKNLWEYMDYQKLQVNSKMYTQNRRNRNKPLREFMVRSPFFQEKQLTLPVPASFASFLQN